MTTDRSFRVGEWQVWPDQGRLAAGGESRDLEPRAMEVLSLLAENPGRIISHREFLDTIWAGRFVQPNILAQAIHSIRRALGDSASDPEYIRTVSRRGYQLIAEVEQPEGAGGTELAPGAGETRFVGRAGELERLGELLAATVAGKGGIGLVRGEAGSGKSYLLQEAIRRGLDRHPELVALAVRCSSLTGGESPFHPFSQLLEELAGELAGTWSGSLLGGHARRVHELVPRTAEVVVSAAPRLLATLLSPATARRLVATARGEPEEQVAAPRLLPVAEAAGDIHRAYAAALKELAGDAPLLLAIDDAQWMDGASTGLLLHLARQLAWSRLLLVVAWRPEGLVDRRGRERPVARALGPLRGDGSDLLIDLDRADGATFVDALLDAEPNRLGAGFRRRLHRQTGGHALFTSELLADLKQRGLLVRDEAGRWTAAGEIDWRQLPGEIEAAVEARLAGLSPTHYRILHAASLQGEEFAAEVVAKALEMPLVEVLEHLRRDLGHDRRLVLGVGVRRRGRRRRSIYRFRHILVQRAVAATVDPADRQRLHEVIAKELEEFAGNGLEEHAIELFYHFAAAGQPHKAARYAVLGAERAAQRNSYEDAVSLCHRALRLLGDDPEERDLGLELDAHLALGGALQASRGYSSRELLETMERARQLALALDDRPRLYSVLRQLVSFYGARGDYPAAHSLAARCRELAHRDDPPNPTGLFISRWMAGWLQVFEGRVGPAYDNLSFVVEQASVADQERLRRLCGIDPTVTPRAWLSWALWLSGRFAQGFEVSRSALDHGQRAQHPHSLAVALYTHCHLLWWSGRLDAIEPPLRRLREHSERHGLAFFEAASTFLEAALGWSEAGDDGGEHRTRIADLLERFEQTGVDGHRSCLHLIQAELLARDGELQASLAAAERGRRHAEAIGEGLCEPELLRLQARVHRQLGDESSSLAALRQAVARAATLGLSAWEARALEDLAVASEEDRPRCRERLAQLLPEAADSLPPELADPASKLTDAGDRPALPSS